MFLRGPFKSGVPYVEENQLARPLPDIKRVAPKRMLNQCNSDKKSGTRPGLTKGKNSGYKFLNTAHNFKLTGAGPVI